MQALLKLSRGIDWLNTQVGKYVIWLILGSTFISGVNAVVLKCSTSVPTVFWKCSGTCSLHRSCWLLATRCCRAST